QQMVASLAEAGAAVAGLSTVPGTDQPALVFAAPYASTSGTVVGYVAAELDLAQLNQALASLASIGRAGTSVFVLDPPGKVLLHPPPTRADAAANPPRVETGTSIQASGPLRYRQNGLEYAAAYGNVSSLGWYVVSTYPVSYAVGGVQAGREWA